MPDPVLFVIGVLVTALTVAALVLVGSQEAQDQ